MKGVYQHCGEQHLHRYLAEFEFRYSNRTEGVDDTIRAEAIFLTPPAVASPIGGLTSHRLSFATWSPACWMTGRVDFQLSDEPKSSLWGFGFILRRFFTVSSKSDFVDNLAPFESAFTRLSVAETDIDDLEAALQGFRQSNGKHIVQRPDTETGERHIYPL